MANIPLEQPQNPDIYLYGFDKNLNRNIEVPLSSAVYDISNLVPSEVVKTEKLSVGNITDLSKIVIFNPNFGTFFIKPLPRSSTPISISSDGGNIEIKTEGGLVHVNAPSGDVKLSASQGAITLDVPSGQVDFNGDILPTTDNARNIGSAIKRLADLRSVLINGADIGFANGWKFREWPATKEDIGKSDEWMKKNANQGIQILDENDNLRVVIHTDGYIYCKGTKSLSELSKML